MEDVLDDPMEGVECEELQEPPGLRPMELDEEDIIEDPVE